MSSQPLVLVVEDEASYREALVAGLGAEGFRVATAADGPTAITTFDRAQPDIVVLDVMLPGISGVDVCREIRTRSAVPIIMVSARTSEIDVVVGLEVGADDYVTKPYRLRELVARLRANLRRAHTVDVDVEVPDRVEIGGVALDMVRHELVINGQRDTIPPREFDLLYTLMTHAGRTLTREQLILRVWGADYRYERE